MRSAIVVVAAMASAVVSMQCGDGGAGGALGHGAGPSGAPATLSVFPATVFSGVDDGGGKYVVPVAVSNGTKVTWQSSDASIATVSGDDTSAMITPLKAGTATITATAGGASATVALTVQTYAAAARTAGQAAFETFKCASCHGAAGPDITSSGICKHTDAQLEAAVTQGANPEGGDVKIGKAAHSFPIAPTDPAYVGIAAFLRSQTPAGIPKPDG